MNHREMSKRYDEIYRVEETRKCNENIEKEKKDILKSGLYSLGCAAISATGLGAFALIIPDVYNKYFSNEALSILGYKYLELQEAGAFGGLLIGLLGLVGLGTNIHRIVKSVKVIDVNSKKIKGLNKKHE